MTEVVVTLTVTNTEQIDSHISLLTKVPDIENKESIETIITRIINSNKVEQHGIGGHIKEIKIVDFKMTKEIKEVDLIKKDETILLIVTATDLETEILHTKLLPVHGEDCLLVAHHEERTYYKGIFGSYTCIHVQCDTMGSIGVSSSIITVREAIRLIKPKVTIMIGIAFLLKQIVNTSCSIYCVSCVVFPEMRSPKSQISKLKSPLDSCAIFFLIPKKS